MRPSKSSKLYSKCQLLIGCSNQLPEPCHTEQPCDYLPAVDLNIYTLKFLQIDMLVSCFPKYPWYFGYLYFAPCRGVRPHGAPSCCPGHLDDVIGRVFHIVHVLVLLGQDPLHLVLLANLPAPQDHDADPSRDVRGTDKDLRGQVVLPRDPDQLLRDRHAEGAGQDDDEPLEVEGRRQVREPHHLGGDGADDGPERAGDGARGEGEEEQVGVAPGGGPDEEGEQAAAEAGGARHVDAPDLVREVPHGRPPDALAQAEDGRDDGALRRVEANVAAVVGQREAERDGAQHGEDAEGVEQEVFGPLEEAHRKGRVPRARGLATVPEEGDADPVDPEGQEAQDAVAPGDPDGPEHGAGRERVHQPAQARPGRGDAVCERPLRREPLARHADGADKDEAHADAKGDALGEEQHPDLVREGRADQGARLDDDAHEEGAAHAQAAREEGGRGRDEHAARDGEAADEGEHERGGARVGVRGEEEGEEDAVGVDAPRVRVHDGDARDADPAVAAVGGRVVQRRLGREGREGRRGLC